MSIYIFDCKDRYILLFSNKKEVEKHEKSVTHQKPVVHQ